MMEALMAMMPGWVKTTMQIADGEVKNISKKEIKEWVQNILCPVRESVRAVLDDPENADLFNTEKTIPTPQQCDELLQSGCDEQRSLELQAMAMCLINHNDTLERRVAMAISFLRELNLGKPRFLRMLKEDYFGKDTKDKDTSWTVPMVQIGSMKADTENKTLTLMPFKESTQNALRWLKNYKPIQNQDISEKGLTF